MGSSIHPGLSVVTLSRVFCHEFRRHARSRGAVVAYVCLALFTSFWGVHQLSIIQYPPVASVTITNAFYVASPGAEVLLLDTATHPFVGPVLLSAGVVVGSTTVASSRVDGTLRTLQTLPYGRRTVFVGLLLERAAGLALVVGVLVVGMALRAQWHGLGISPFTFVAFGVALAIHATAGVAVGSLVSTLSPDRTSALAVAVVAAAGLLALGALLAALVPPAQVLDPQATFHVVLAGFDSDWTARSLAESDGTPRTPPTPTLAPATAFAFQVAWIAVPAALGAVRYRRSDLQVP